MEKLAIFLIVFAFGALFACSGEPNSGSPPAPALGEKGMVSSAHPLATKCGLDILKSGGNAFDAAVAIAAALNVVEPMMSGMGGYGTILIYDAEKSDVRFLNCSSRIPAAVDSDVYRFPAPDYKKNRRGAKAVSTPGNVHAWEAMSKEYGVLQWEELFAPAIELAEKGYIVDERIARLIASAYPSFPDHARVFYGIDGRPLESGERLVQKDLAQSLRAIAEGGAEVFYAGRIALAIHEAMAEAGGFLSVDDLRADLAEWYAPISIQYRDCQVLTASPPATAFPSLIRLGMMQQFDTQELSHNSAAYLHRFAEITRHAFNCRLKYAGDPEFYPPPLEKLLSEDYWRSEVQKIDTEKASEIYAPLVPIRHTTHFVVADHRGNIVSATQTLGNSFGSRIMPEGTGIWLNNSLAYCTFEPAGNPMDAHAGWHKLSGDCPTILMKDGKPWVAIGTPGGHTIGQTVPQMVMNLVDFGLSIQEAIDAPRISFIEPDIIAVENGIPQKVHRKLEEMGHNIRSGGSLGCAHGLMLQYGENGTPIRFFGGADSRGSGLAQGVLIPHTLSIGGMYLTMNQSIRRIFGIRRSCYETESCTAHTTNL